MLTRHGGNRVTAREQLNRHQQAVLRRTHDRSAESLIVFATPGADPATGVGLLSGGVMSICAICEASSCSSTSGLIAASTVCTSCRN